MNNQNLATPLAFSLRLISLVLTTTSQYTVVSKFSIIIIIIIIIIIQRLPSSFFRPTLIYRVTLFYLLNRIKQVSKANHDQTSPSIHLHFSKFPFSFELIDSIRICLSSKFIHSYIHSFIVSKKNNPVRVNRSINSINQSVHRSS